MRLCTIMVMATLVGCTPSGSVCKSDAGPDRTTALDGAVIICTVAGTWASSKNTITFAADGTFTATLDGTSDSGTWSVTGILGCGATVTLADSACGTNMGSYGISIAPSCTTMSLSGQGDDCGMRANELSDTQYKKQ